MDTMSAMINAEANRNKPAKVFDWDTAAQRMRDASAIEAEAWLESDEEWTGDTILRDGHPVLDGYTFLSSTWAMPMLRIDGVETECWKWKKGSGWDSGTVWPDSAKAIFAGENE